MPIDAAVTSQSEGFQPKILAFLCNWCGYAGADLAGTSRLQYPASIRVIRVLCSATVSPHHVLKAFQRGADGVLVVGCHIGDCHYLKGNYMTVKRMVLLKELLEFTGLGSERLRLEWVSAAEGPKFAQVITDFTSQIRKIGASTLKSAKQGVTKRG
jgi:F420-non-reducing hydrogenase iron-sulfur subunit